MKITEEQTVEEYKAEIVRLSKARKHSKGRNKVKSRRSFRNDI